MPLHSTPPYVVELAVSYCLEMESYFGWAAVELRLTLAVTGWFSQSPFRLGVQLVHVFLLLAQTQPVQRPLPLHRQHCGMACQSFKLLTRTSRYAVYAGRSVFHSI